MKEIVLHKFDTGEPITISKDSIRNIRVNQNKNVVINYRLVVRESAKEVMHMIKENDNDRQ